MRKKLNNQIKDYLHDYLEETREERQITRAEMSEHLCMDVRTYAYHRKGEYNFSLVSFLLLLWELGERKFDVIDDLMYIISKAKDESGE